MTFARRRGRTPDALGRRNHDVIWCLCRGSWAFDLERESEFSQTEGAADAVCVTTQTALAVCATVLTGTRATYPGRERMASVADFPLLLFTVGHGQEINIATTAALCLHPVR